MNWTFQLRQLPKELKLLVLLFLFSMLFGYGASFMILVEQTSLSADGIEENYLGNEENETANTIKFKKSKFQMLSSVHSHVFTLSVIFLLTGFLAYFTGLPNKGQIVYHYRAFDFFNCDFYQSNPDVAKLHNV